MLEEYELVHREVYKVVSPKVEYSLTENGLTFILVIEVMQVWGSEIINKKWRC